MSAHQLDMAVLHNFPVDICWVIRELTNMGVSVKFSDSV